jgi:hypothetical protein
MTSIVKIIDAALVLRAESPDGWERFVEAMREYAAATTAEMVRCNPELLLKAQGMALIANDIANILVNAPKLKEKQHERPISGPTGY